MANRLAPAHPLGITWKGASAWLMFSRIFIGTHFVTAWTPVRVRRHENRTGDRPA
jgi:hypothetical protein